MATFEGTVDEFRRYLGPRIKNAVNQFTRKDRRARGGVCEECGRDGQILQSAHVHKRDRKAIIEKVLATHRIGEQVRCDLTAVEKQILDDHGPVAKAFKFLCGDCHRRYDANPLRPPMIMVSSERMPVSAIGGDGLEIQFEPAPEAAFKAELLKTKRAYVTLHVGDRIETAIWKADNFSANSSLRSNLRSGYLRNATSRGISRAVFSVAPAKS